MTAPPPRTPGDDHPHVTEGVCTCPAGERLLSCGLSSHRVAAAAAREIQRSNRA